MNIPFGKPNIGNEELRQIKSVLNSGQLVHGTKTKSFENSFENLVGGGYATSLSSCTAGLHLSYIALGIGKGDEVLVPALSHVATVHSVEYVGAKPIFLDAETETGNIKLSEIEKKINNKTKALCIVHYLGLPLNMERVLQICKKYNLFLIEDCALALGARYKGKHVGLFGDVGSFSFYPIKHITTAEGGMVISKKKSIISKLQKLKAFGYDKTLKDRKIPGKYGVDILGYNFRMNEIEAAIGFEQLKKFPTFFRKRLNNMKVYKKFLSNNKSLKIIDNDDKFATNSYYCATVVLNKKIKNKRDLVLKNLIKSGIGCSIYYPGPIPAYKFYKEKYNISMKEFKGADLISNGSIALPLGPHVTNENVKFICKKLEEIVISLS
ncbi:MAG: cell wall biogenesis protein [Flavobacteriaceae bacterium]|nr:cell wall biogenesis protein [Flavobacteriaceae bacterium]|tara:strand:+ start:11402 stop:12544 length:1143 start_codon:yes stop_codon:yes gene_type:complete